MKVLGKIFLGISTVFVSSAVQAQTQVFAELQGTPVINTTGWNMTGNAVVGDADGDGMNNDVILTPAVNGTSGAIFFNQPINLTQCQKWKVEYDFRMFGGSGADGIALCFIDVPPTGFVVGGGVGIPANVNGLKVVFDTFENQFGTLNNPQIQIRYGTGYDQFAPPFNTQPSTPTGQYFLRSSTYQSARVEYDNGSIKVFVNNTLYLSGFYLINFTGYLGFTSSTGGENDRHSIKNVTIYTDIAPSNAGADVSYCTGSSAQIGTTPNPNYTYSWSPSTGLSANNIANPTVSLTNLGAAPITLTYTVTTTLTGSTTACSSSDQVVVTVNPTPGSQFLLSKSTVCPNEPVTVTYTGNALATSNYTWDFNGGTVISGSGQGPYQVSWPNQGNIQVTLSVAQNACTSAVTTKNLTVRPKPVLIVSGVPSICLGDTAVYTGTVDVANSGIAWVPGPLTGSQVNLHPTVTTTYTAVATSPNGCVSDDTTFILTVIPKPVAQITGDSIICKGDTILLTGTSSVPLSTFEWLPMGDTTSQVWVHPTVNQLYQLVANRNGCLSDTAEFSVRVDSLPSLILPDSLSICVGESVNVVAANSVPPGTLFDWQPGSLTGSQNTLSPTSSTQYTVYAYNETCTSDVKILEIEVLQSCDCKLAVPNIFTPNGDQVNDEFSVLNVQNCEIAQFDLALMNRWGAVVWKSSNILEKWDGKCMMGNCSDGTYFWVLNYSFLPGGIGSPKAVSEKGTLTIAH
jgi:gliding motility-associated-like protein